MGWKPLLIFLVISNQSRANDLSSNSIKKALPLHCQILDQDISSHESRSQILKRKILSLKGASDQVNPLKRPKHRSQIELLEAEIKELEKKLNSLNKSYKKNCS
jgi:hypothetical protein